MSSSSVLVGFLLLDRFVDRCLSFCPFSFAIVLSVLCRFEAFDYPFGITHGLRMGLSVPAPHATPVVLLLSDTNIISDDLQHYNVADTIELTVHISLFILDIVV
jgi:hypothetical protein